VEVPRVRLENQAGKLHKASLPRARHSTRVQNWDRQSFPSSWAVSLSCRDVVERDDAEALAVAVETGVVQAPNNGRPASSSFSPASPNLTASLWDSSHNRHSTLCCIHHLQLLQPKSSSIPKSRVLTETSRTMAPLAPNAILDVLRRSAKASPDAFATVSSLAKRAPFSPMAVYQNLFRRATLSDGTKYDPGTGSKPANAFNNNIMLIMFAVIGSCMALGVLWFFFMAKNGGFTWRNGDWDDYKSTVLRRKGPDGKTLSNATKSTKLGGGSIVPKWHKRWSGKSSNAGSDYYDKYSDISASSPAKSIISNSTHDSDVEMAESPRRHNRTPNRQSHQRSRSHLQNQVQDPEFDAYRSERPAAVGGYNKPAEGSHYDYTNTDRSEFSSQMPAGKISRKERKDRDKREKETRSKNKDAKSPKKNPPSPTRSPVQHASTISSNSRQSHPHGVAFPSPSAKERGSYYTNYRPTGPTLRAVGPEDQRTNSQRQNHRRSVPNLPGSYADDDYEDVDHSYVGSEETGTKSYKHHIPGLADRSEVGVDDSVSRVGANPSRNAGRKTGGGSRRPY
jgi:hypothetical protein